VKLLLDTHIWVWSLMDPDQLGARVTQELEDQDNDLYLSAISVWETLILGEKGRLLLEPSPQEWVREALLASPIKDLPLNREIALRSRTLALSHQDPADRWIAATAAVHELTLVTHDSALRELSEISVLPNV
jgi:PIN domain nuclease of toxin-antitoxin system